MNLPSFTSRRPAVAASAAVVAAAALILAGCGSSSSGGSSGGSGAASNSGGSSGSGGSSLAGASDASAFFPVAVGNAWTYKTTGFGSGSGSSTNRITAVAPVAGGQRVAMEVKVQLPGSTTPESASHEYFIFHSDGSISIPLTQFGGVTESIESGSVVWPSAAQLASGQPHSSTLVIKVAEAGHKLTIKEHVVVRGDGTASVTVPAGTYQATVIDESMSSKTDGISVDLQVKTWLANGVGPVKSEVLSTDGGKMTISSTQELVSFHKG